MWWTITVGLVVVCVVFAILNVRYCFQGEMYFHFSWICGALAGLSLLVFPMAAVATSNDGELVKSDNVSSGKLYAFQDSKEIESQGGGGVFFWGFSSEGKLKYRYITDGSIGKVIKESYISNFEIVENENKNPRIEYHPYVYKRSGVCAWLFGEDGDTIIIKVAYIPEGSLIQEYSVDLE